MSKLNKILNNKIIIYLTSRYAVYGIQFITGMVLAGKLGPYYMGVYGFLQMILMYLTQINLGIPHSLNVLLVHNKDNRALSNDYIGNSLLISCGMSSLVGLFYLYYRTIGISSFERYHVDKYIIWICIVGALQYFNSLFQIVVRIKNKLQLLAFMQSLTILLNFVAIWLFSGETLITVLVANNMFSNIVCAILAYRNDCFPKLQNVHIKTEIVSEIVKKGFYLFLYNSCFYFIVISIRTIISVNYTIEEFGKFTFSYSVGHALLLLSSAISTIIFPKMIAKLSNRNNDEVIKVLNTVRISYISATYFLVFLALPFFPILLHFLPKYQDAIFSMNLLALAVLIHTNSFGYSSLLIARNQEKKSAIISILSLFLNISFAFFIVKVLKVEYSRVILSIMLTYLFSALASTYIGTKIIGLYSIKKVFADTFPLRLFIPYLVAVLLSLLGVEILIFIPLLIYLTLNRKDVILIFKYIRQMISNQNMTDL